MRTRSIVVVLLGVTALFVFIGAAVFLFGGDDRRVGALAKDSRSFAAGHFAFYMDTPSGQQQLGFLKSFSGCGISADVAGVGPDAGGVIRKHVAGIAYEPCVLQFGVTGMDTALYNWIGSALERNATSKGFWLVSTSYDYKPLSGSHLVDAAIEKVTFPAVDASAKEAGYITLTLRPDSITEFATCCGSFTPGILKSGPTKQKQWSGSSFRFTLGKIADTKKVSKIESWTFTQEGSGAKGSPAELHLANLEVTTAKSSNAPWRQWFEDFVIQGINDDASETTASIEFLSPNLQDVLATLSFKGVGIVGFESGGESSKDTIARETYTLYVEEASFAGSGGTTPAPAPAPQPQSSTGTTTGAEPPPPPPPEEPAPEERKLAAPEELKGTPGREEVELAWTPVEGAESYVILASSSTKEPEFNELAESKETSIVIADLRPGTYLFVVRARAGDAESEDSRPIEIVIE
jgi:hypothetical protein